MKQLLASIISLVLLINSCNVYAVFTSHHEVNKSLSEQYLFQGREAYHKKDFYNAFRLFQESASLNNATASFIVGIFYFSPPPGISIEQNSDLALEYMQQAAQFGNIQAKKMVQTFQLKGFGNTPPEKIIQLRSELETQLLTNSADKITNLYDLVDSYLFVKQKELRNVNKAEFFINALFHVQLNEQQKYMLANYCMTLSFDYMMGLDSLKKNPQKAFEWMQRATQLHLKEAFYNLSDMYFYGYGTSVNFRKSLALLRQGNEINWSSFNVEHRKHFFSFLKRPFIYLNLVRTA